MNCPSLHDLPAPPPNLRGWPWTEASTPPAAAIAGKRAWPKISIITPSYNQGQYLEETIRSVLLQGYPDLEYFIIDGGSTDESVDIIRKYEPWLTGWVSERDSGQSEAINKGYARCTGEIFNWVCSDDLLAANALGTVAVTFTEKPECDVIAGYCYCKYEDDPAKSEVRPSSVERIRDMPYAFAVWQPSCFFRRSLITRPNLVREDMHYCMDRELWCYLEAQKAKWKQSDEVLSVNRFTGSNKSLTGRSRVIDELDKIYRAYVNDLVSLTFWLRKVWLPLALTHKDHDSRLVRAASRFLSRGVTLALRTLYPQTRVQVLQKEYYRYAI